jgi:hypothetical protein
MEKKVEKNLTREEHRELFFKDMSDEALISFSKMSDSDQEFWIEEDFIAQNGSINFRNDINNPEVMDAWDSLMDNFFKKMKSGQDF